MSEPIEDTRKAVGSNALLAFVYLAWHSYDITRTCKKTA